MVETSMTDAERATVEACASQFFHADDAARDRTRAVVLAALRALNPGARLPGGLAVVWANQAELLGYTPAAAALAERNKRDYEAAARSTERLSPEQEAAAHGPPSPGNGG